MTNSYLLIVLYVDLRRGGSPDKWLVVIRVDKKVSLIINPMKLYP